MEGNFDRCPFLRQVAEREGEAFARHVACRPTVAYSRSAGPVLQEDVCDFAATFQLFHGPSGVVPLRTGSLPAGRNPTFWMPAFSHSQNLRITCLNGSEIQCVLTTPHYPAGGSCPFDHASKGAQPASRNFASATAPAAVRQQRRPPTMAGAPFASLSLSFGLPVSSLYLAQFAITDHSISGLLPAATLQLRC